jgi:Na+-driven multidrug efflux pump
MQRLTGMYHRYDRAVKSARIGLIMAWGAILIFGLPGLVLAGLNDPQNVPIALSVLVIGIAIATALTVVFRRGRVPYRRRHHHPR